MFPCSRRLLGIGTVFLLWTTAIGSASAQSESILGGFDVTEWSVGNQKRDSNQIATEFVRAGENINNWTVLFTAQFLRKPSSVDPIEVLVPKMHQETSKRCPGMTWNVIARQSASDSEPESMLYEWTIKDCPPDADQHEVARVLYGKFNVFRLAYVAKTTTLAPEVREKWIKELKAAKIVRR